MKPTRIIRQINIRSRRLVALVAFSLCVAALADDAPQASIVLPTDADPLVHLAAEELQFYVKTLFNVDATIGETPAPDGFVFRLGVAQDGQTDQGLLLKPDGNTLLVSGGSPRAVLWAVYELVERWGVRYLVHGDVLPEDPGPLRFPEAEIKLEPNLRTRCWRLVNDLADGPVSWSLEENRRFLRQIAKMKYNRVFLSFWPCQPFVHYSFQGMQKPTGSLFFGESFPIDHDTVGREKLVGMTEFTNPDFAGATSPEDLVNRATALAHGILEEAKRLGMETGLAIQPFEWPKEFMDVLPGSEPVTQLGSLTAGPGKNQPLDDPLLREMVATIFRAYIETYPEAEYIHVGMPEHRGWTDQALHAYEALDNRYALRDLGSFTDLCARARQRTTFPGGGDRVEAMLKGDLAALAFLDSLIQEQHLLARAEGQPDAKLVYSNVVEELFPLLAKMLPPGGEVLSFIDYTASRQLRQRDLLRQRPPDGLPVNLIFTLADDNVGILPQLATQSLSELMMELRANGWNGFYTRYWTVGDLNPTVHFLSRASWDADVTPEAAYRDLVEHVCGADAVDPVVSALQTIEDITKGLDEHGLGFGFPVPGMMTKHYDAGGLSTDLKTDHARYQDALTKLRTAREHCAPRGLGFLDYLLGRLVFAVKYLDAADGFGQVAKSEKAGNPLEAARQIEQTYADIREATQAWADVAQDHGDLGAVALLNQYAYRPIRDKRNTLAGGADIVERVPVGVAGDYKPCLNMLPDGELLTVAFHQNLLDGGKIREDILLFRSSDGGRTWSGPQTADIVGREPYLSVLKDGTILVTVHLLPQDVRNSEGYTHAYIHRSDDGGISWTSTPAQPEEWPPGTETVTSRTVLEMTDGSLMLLVSGKGRGHDAVWRSRDGGKTWDQKYAAQVEGVRDDYPFPFFGEAVLWQATSGKVFAIARVDSKFFPPLPGHDIALGETDHYDRMILYTSGDEGHTWEFVRDFGDYGEMYPAILRLQDGRLLLTYTVREVNRPLGVRAVLGMEEPDDFAFNFEQLPFILDAKTPNDKDSGGGFGRTVQLEDGTLVTSYSYRGEDDDVHCEIARWNVPESVRPTPPESVNVKVVEGGESARKAPECRVVIVGPGANEPEPFPGYRGFVGWESPIRLRNGTWIVGFNAGYWHASGPTPFHYPPQTLAEYVKMGMPADVDAPTGGRSMLTRSDDEGRTWSKPELLIDTPADDRHPSFLELPSGTILCSFFTYMGSGDFKTDPSLAYRTRVIRSTDGGSSWLPEVHPLPSPFIADESDGPMILTKDGSVILAINGTPEDGSPDQVALLRSADEGVSWELVSTIGTDHDLFEPSVAELPDGRLVLIARPEGDICWSEDKGRTWTEPVSFGMRLFAPSLYVGKDGTLLCLHGSYGAGGLRAIFSTDGGRTWVAPASDYGFLVDSSYGYGKAMELPDGSFFIVYISTGGHAANEAGNNAVWCIQLRIRPDHSGIDLLPAPNRGEGP